MPHSIAGCAFLWKNVEKCRQKNFLKKICQIICTMKSNVLPLQGNGVQVMLTFAQFDNVDFIAWRGTDGK